MKRVLMLAYGFACYLMFLGVYAALAVFVGNLPVGLPTIDAPAAGSVETAVAVNLLLIGVFAAQHSVMARPGFKKVWTKVVPRPIERSTYVLAANLVTLLLIWQWRPIDTVMWHVEMPAARTAIWALFVAGWLAVPAVTLLINHFDLFGLRQVWCEFRGRKCEPLPFRTPLAYAHVRHPLYMGWALAFWATPTMTAGHLLFAASMTVYMALAARVEERDLIDHFGRQYRQYREQVPMFIPRLRPFEPVAGTPAEFVVNLSPH
jgi:protein-S-isoprenylcysteine O-methyltransferase Ste14